INDPAQRELLGVDHAQIGTHLGAGIASELVELVRAPRDEEHGITVVQAQLRLQRCRPLFADILGNRPRALPVLEEDIAQTRLALALRPAIHAVTERPADWLGTGLVL